VSFIHATNDLLHEIDDGAPRRALYA
jgi:hypothetical protein